MSGANNKANKYESHQNRKPYPDDERHRLAKKYDSPGNNRPSIRREQDMRRGRDNYRDERDPRDIRENKYQLQDRSREYANSSRPSHNYEKKESIADSSNNRYYHDTKRYNDSRRQRSKSRDKSHSKHRTRDDRSRGHEHSKQKERDRGRYERSSSAKRSRSRRRYRSKSRKTSRSSRSYSRQRSYSRRTGSYSSGYSNDNRRRRSGYDYSWKHSTDRRDGRSRERERDRHQRPRDFPQRSQRNQRNDGKDNNYIKKVGPDLKDNREARPRDNKYSKDQRDRQHQNTSINSDNKYLPNAKDKHKPDSRIYPQKQSQSNKQTKDNPNGNLQDKLKSPTIPVKSQSLQDRLITDQQGPFLKNPPELRAPIRIELEHLSHEQKPFFSLDQQLTKHSKRPNIDTRIHPQEQLIGNRPPISRPKREKEPQPIKHENLPKPPPSKLLNETEQLIKSARALTNFRLPESNFLIVESFRRLDGYEFELEGLAPEWRSKLEDDKSNINLLRSEWMNTVQYANGFNGNKKTGMVIESSQGVAQSMIPPRHFRLEKSQFVNPEYEDRLEQIAEAIRSKTKAACEASRKLIYIEVELQALLAKRLHI